MAVSLKKKVANVVGVVTKQHSDGSQEEEKTVVADGMIDEPHATVGFSVGMTKNLGNYNSVKITVSLYMPCSPDPDSVEATYHTVRGWVDGKANDINMEIENQLGV